MEASHSSASLENSLVASPWWVSKCLQRDFIQGHICFPCQKIHNWYDILHQMTPRKNLENRDSHCTSHLVTSPRLLTWYAEMGSSRIPAGAKTGCPPKLLDIRHCGFWWLYFWYFLNTKWSEAWVLWLLPFLFADEAAITKHSEDELQKLINRLSAACRDFGLPIKQWGKMSPVHLTSKYLTSILKLFMI